MTTNTQGAADLIAALKEAQSAINSMKVEAETAAQGDEQMMLEACETISNEGLQADMAIRAALAFAAAQSKQETDATHLRELAAYRLTVENLEREIAAQQPAPSPAPAGWKLVPVEPTEEMLKAADDGDDAYTLRCFGPGVQRVMQGPYDHYCAMLDAAPTAQADTQPAQQGVSYAALPESFLEIPDVQDESGINAYYSREVVLECIDAALASHGQAPAETGNSVSAQADSVPAIQGETNVQLDTDPNPTAPGQQRDMACSLALGRPVGNGSDQVAGHPSAQGDKLLTVAERNIRSFLRSATFKSESDREAALNCVDVLWEAARASEDSVLEDAARLDWLLLRISGAEFRRLGVHYSGNARRADVDAARKQGASHD